MSRYMREVSSWRYVGFFFFQAEDGIRDADVTAVQTCALPISRVIQPGSIAEAWLSFIAGSRRCGAASARTDAAHRGAAAQAAKRRLPARARRVQAPGDPSEIGRASCRERVEVEGVAGGL